MEGNKSPVNGQGARQSSPPKNREDQATYSKTALRLAPNPHRPVKPGHQLLDVSTCYFSSFRSHCFVCRFHVEEVDSHKHQPPTYFMERVFYSRVDPCLLRCEYSERNVRRLCRRRAALRDRRCPSRVDRCGKPLWDVSCCDIWREHDEQLCACYGSSLECVNDLLGESRNADTRGGQHGVL